MDKCTIIMSETEDGIKVTYFKDNVLIDVQWADDWNAARYILEEYFDA